MCKPDIMVFIHQSFTLHLSIRRATLNDANGNLKWAHVMPSVRKGQKAQRLFTALKIQISLDTTAAKSSTITNCPDDDFYWNYIGHVICLIMLILVLLCIILFLLPKN